MDYIAMTILECQPIGFVVSIKGTALSFNRMPVSPESNTTETSLMQDPNLIPEWSEVSIGPGHGKRFSDPILKRVVCTCECINSVFLNPMFCGSSVENVIWTLILNPKSLNAGENLLLMASESHTQTQQILCVDVSQ